ncbi:FMNH2-dependent monooxygenase [Actinophytocola xanthii]|uniref:FMNH2-dependent monooxygenase n=1 Tax=Actinophytocola xanthii TaxID=1912961 RepID=A0A1Q8CYA6_9PSEU|nr:FMNH2-dependent monooxygenase [Actinophytocola xanthii]
MPHLAVALDGAGWHPAAWREPDARPAELFTAGYWTDLVREAERGALDLVTIEDSFGVGSTQDARVDRVYGRLDATLVAAAVAPRTSAIGLVPTVVATHTEPFHVSKAVASLDYASVGRAGYRVRISTSPAEFAHVGRREAGEVGELLAEAADHVEVVRRLWDSWEDDAEIRDAATGRFVDRSKLHYIDFTGQWFSVKGPSITPRPPQGQPPVVVLAHAAPVYRLAARAADVVLVTPRDPAHATELLAEVRAEELAVGRPTPLHVFGELVVFLDETTAGATGRLARLDERDGGELRSDAAVFAGTVDDLADLLLDLCAAGLTGIRLRPGALPHDLVAVTRGLVPRLQARGSFRRHYTEGTLRARLGLARPANRYAEVTR